MKNVVEIFDPPMCCPTGVCGPSVDPKLIEIQHVISQLQAEGVTVQRYQVTTHPAAFLRNTYIASLMRTPEGLKSLPVTAVNGMIVGRGGYPSLGDIRKVLR